MLLFLVYRATNEAMSKLSSAMCIIISLVLLTSFVQSVPLASDDDEVEQIQEEDDSPRLKTGDEQSKEYEQGIRGKKEHQKLRAIDTEGEGDFSSDQEEVRYFLWPWWPTTTEVNHVVDDQSIKKAGKYLILRTADEETDNSDDQEEASHFLWPWWPPKLEPVQVGDDQEEGKYPIWWAADEKQEESSDQEKDKRKNHYVWPKHRKIALRYGKYERKPWHWLKRGVKFRVTGLNRGYMYSPESNFQLSPQFQELIKQFEH